MMILVLSDDKTLSKLELMIKAKNIINNEIFLEDLAKRGILEQEGKASFYSDRLKGKLMANGKPYNPDAFTAASNYYDLGSWVRVERKFHGHYNVVDVEITDRGPNKRFKNRIIDLSRHAFEFIGKPKEGLIDVEVSLLTTKK